MNEKKQIFVIAGLLVVLILVWVLVLRPPAKKEKNKSIIDVEESGLEFKVILDMVDEYSKNKAVVQELSYEAGKDPFSLERKKISPDKMTASEIFEGLELKGILWDAKKPLAIIGGEVVRQGGMIKGVRIKEIKPTYVALEALGEEKILFIEGVSREIKNEMEGLK